MTEERIQTALQQLELDLQIKILLACETGSRAWGFPSPDSDYDVRIVYVHQPDWYWSLKEGKDSLELMLDANELDITGWELRKSLRLLAKSNGALLERLQSPILYKQDKQFLREISELSKRQYSRIAGMYHYLNMGLNCLTELDRNKPYKLKKFFYTLRAATACKWILEKSTSPPIVFMEMVEGLGFNTGLKQQLLDLIELKAGVSEGYLHEGETQLFELIDQFLSEGKAGADTLPAASGRLSDLNEFFRTTVQRVWT